MDVNEDTQTSKSLWKIGSNTHTVTRANPQQPPQSLPNAIIYSVVPHQDQTPETDPIPNNGLLAIINDTSSPPYSSDTEQPPPTTTETNLIPENEILLMITDNAPPLPSATTERDTVTTTSTTTKAANPTKATPTTITTASTATQTDPQTTPVKSHQSKPYVRWTRTELQRSIEYQKTAQQLKQGPSSGRSLPLWQIAQSANPPLLPDRSPSSIKAAWIKYVDLDTWNVDRQDPNN